jgi:hypothetical protein
MLQSGGGTTSVRQIFFRVVFILQSGGGTTSMRIYKVFSIILYPYTTVIPFIYSERELLFFR